jgi:hypothetical protein
MFGFDFRRVSVLPLPPISPNALLLQTIFGSPIFPLTARVFTFPAGLAISGLFLFFAPRQFLIEILDDAAHFSREIRALRIMPGHSGSLLA